MDKEKKDFETGMLIGAGLAMALSPVIKTIGKTIFHQDENIEKLLPIHDEHDKHHHDHDREHREIEHHTHGDETEKALKYYKEHHPN